MIKNEIELNNNLTKEPNLEIEQNNFLDTMLGKAINTGIDIGLRTILPDLIEDQVINIKDNLFNYGLKEGIEKTIEEAINFGKSSLGIITGNFENVSQMQLAVKNGGIIDSVSGVFDLALNKIEQKGIVDSSTAHLIKQGKNTILNNIESNIEKSFTNQLEGIENLDRHISNWKKHYNEQDFSSMEKDYKKIQKELSSLVPLEKTLSSARTVENLHNLIKTNGQNFDLSETEKELLQKLS